MKIDYAIVSSNSNSLYLDFWPIVSKLWKKKIGVEPILVYIDPDQNVNLSEEDGQVFRWKYIKNIPISIQVLWIRYWFPTMFPNKVSIISDIDMLPLSRHYFVDQIKNISEDKYIHINPCMESYGRIPSCYHVAKGSMFKKVLDQPERWEDSIAMLHEDFQNPKEELTSTYWFLDEDYPSSVIPKYKEENPLEVLYLPRTGGQNGMRIDRSNWQFDLDKVKANYYYDSHSARPYSENKEDIDSICKAALLDSSEEDIIIEIVETTTPETKEEAADSYPIITGMGFRKYADFIYDEFQKDDVINLIKENDKIIFLKTDYISDFFKNVLSKIEYNIILITHNSAQKMEENDKQYLDNDKITKWYAQNACLNHPKLESIPLGIANARWTHGNVETLKNASEQMAEKNNLLYVNFNTNTNPKREEVLEKFKDCEYSIFSERKPFKEYLEEVASCKYALSPEGMGTDCHRIWECLYLNTIPIVERCHNISFYKDLPILIINDWEEISEEYLNEKYEEIFIKFEKNKHKLHIKYWINKIKKLQYQKDSPHWCNSATSGDLLKTLMIWLPINPSVVEYENSEIKNDEIDAVIINATDNSDPDDTFKNLKEFKNIIAINNTNEESTKKFAKALSIDLERPSLKKEDHTLILP